MLGELYGWFYSEGVFLREDERGYHGSHLAYYGLKEYACGQLPCLYLGLEFLSNGNDICKIPDNTEGWLTGLLGFGAFLLGMGGLIGVLKVRSSGPVNSGTKSYEPKGFALGGGALTFLILWVIGMVIGTGLDWNTGIGIAFGGGCGGCILTSAISWISTHQKTS